VRMNNAESGSSFDAKVIHIHTKQTTALCASRIRCELWNAIYHAYIVMLFLCTSEIFTCGQAGKASTVDPAIHERHQEQSFRRRGTSNTPDLKDTSRNSLALQAVWACKKFLREMAQPFTHEDQLKGRALLTVEQV
jgi:hypothetical protein